MAKKQTLIETPKAFESVENQDRKRGLTSEHSGRRTKLVGRIADFHDANVVTGIEILVPDLVFA
jgi:hypothetical protein